jgi:hypothetical protein
LKVGSPARLTRPELRKASNTQLALMASIKIIRMWLSIPGEAELNAGMDWLCPANQSCRSWRGSQTENRLDTRRRKHRVNRRLEKRQAHRVGLRAFLYDSFKGEPFSEWSEPIDVSIRKALGIDQSDIAATTSSNGLLLWKRSRRNRRHDASE